jgi:hypothetical protein
MDSPCSSLSVAPSPVSHHAPEQPLGRAPVRSSLTPYPRSAVDRRRHGPQAMDRVHAVFPLENNSKTEYSSQLYKKAHVLIEY